MTKILAGLLASAIIVLTRLVTAVQARWSGCGPDSTQRVYFANHASHGDFVLIWTVLPPALRKKTRPVAGADYWLKGRLRAFIAKRVINAVLIERRRSDRDEDPIAIMASAIDERASLILFPEGTRNTTDDQLLPFKSGLYLLASARRDIEFVPVWLANLNRVLPKGEFVPIPLLCTVTFGQPLKLQDSETKNEFLARARGALLRLAPNQSADIGLAP